VEEVLQSRDRKSIEEGGPSGNGVGVGDIVPFQPKERESGDGRGRELAPQEPGSRGGFGGGQ